MQNFNSKFKINKLLTFALLTLTFDFALLTFNFDKAEASALSLAVYPPILQIEANAPAVINSPIIIKNLGSEPIELKIILKPFTSKKENGEVNFLQKEEIQGKDPLILQKIKVMENNNNIENLILAPEQQKDLSLYVDIPKDEPPSDYYFSIVFLSSSFDEETKLNISNLTGGIAINTLLSIGPKGKTIGEVAEFSSPFFMENGPVPFKVRVNNTNSYFIYPTGSILIKNMFGQTVGKVDLLPVNILAGTIRAIPDNLQSSENTSSATLPPAPRAKFAEELRADNSVNAFWPESFLLGFYTATLTLALSNQGPVFTRNIHFVAFPFKIIIGLLIAVFLVLLIRNRLKNHL
ncbi:hypothetical protein C4559_05145 [Candidatus Microgenomates bacterium]|nr:MAG: hypothetical protein C4559_05145 [Candidatus Microgenomates bacterium]